MHVQDSPHIFRLLCRIRSTLSTRLPPSQGLLLFLFLNPRVYRSEAGVLFYPCCFSIPCSSHPCLFVNFLDYFFCLQDNSQAFRGCVFRWND